MLSNLLSRAERPFELILGRRSDPATVGRVREAIRLAGIARGIGRSRLGGSGGRSTATRTSISTIRRCAQ